MPISKSIFTTKPEAKHKNVAIIGAGMAGIVCARTLAQAGHKVTVFEKNEYLGGRMATCSTPFGTFDSGAQYFTVRDPRFVKALATVPGLCKPWSATTVRVLDEAGRVAAAGTPPPESHWVATPGMNGLVSRWALPLMDQHNVELETRVTRLERDVLNGHLWQLRTQGQGGTQLVVSGFDNDRQAIPAEPALLLLQTSPRTSLMAEHIHKVHAAPGGTRILP